jgi:hypothetical protein
MRVLIQLLAKFPPTRRLLPVLHKAAMPVRVLILLAVLLVVIGVPVAVVVLLIL